ncbi:hypothetical protein [Paenibacillus radicis (ex Gao et al. 2016)]|uniref:Uncharacterized protein n=1 Tax=Paenibacillus radicis (ex Gao et al. 2016) TaxID=1737354 RepID=A0A917H781_9BACL|nr:hypothetical protein [Paenibacillus radicis (ex Gao et al. 2016)]GGG69740.1 hypothetical protein GCM10010918_26200 [Paenibacillus radicis (ex Gao et al. 2016)]
MNRLKHSGFYKLKFLITPEEFKHVLKLFERQQAQFNHTNYAQTKHDHTQVYEAYEKFYHYFTAPEKPEYHPFFVYSISFTAGNESSGFFIRNESISFPYLGQWAEDELPSIMLSLPKGFQIDVEDESGKYYIYEDIREHQPLTYTFYNDIVNDIKKITKPFRFFIYEADAVQEQKPPVRISKNAANELMNAWIFKKYKLVIGGL